MAGRVANVQSYTYLYCMDWIRTRHVQLFLTAMTVNGGEMVDQGHATVLIVDDDKTRLLLDVFVKADGYRTLLAADGADALRLAREMHPDVVLLDVIMPDMDGFQVARRLKDDPATRAIPLIIVSALDDGIVRARLKACGAEEFIGKPVDRWDLSRRLGRLLHPGSTGTGEAGP